MDALFTASIDVLTLHNSNLLNFFQKKKKRERYEKYVHCARHRQDPKLLYRVFLKLVYMKSKQNCCINYNVYALEVQQKISKLRKCLITIYFQFCCETSVLNSYTFPRHLYNFTFSSKSHIIRHSGRSSSPSRTNIFPFSTSSRPTGAHPTSYPMGTGGSFSG
jgi:hypothetical protein